MFTFSSAIFPPQVASTPCASSPLVSIATSLSVIEVAPEALPHWLLPRVPHAKAPLLAKPVVVIVPPRISTNHRFC